MVVLEFSIDYFWVPYLLSGISGIISFLEVVSQMSLRSYIFGPGIKKVLSSRRVWGTPWAMLAYIGIAFTDLLVLKNKDPLS